MVLWQTRCVPATFCNPALLFSQDVRGFGGIWLSEKSEKVFQETAVPDDKGCPGSLLLCNNITMTTVPSAGCLLAKNHYYRTRLNSDSSVSSSSSSCSSDPISFSDQEKNHHGLPEIFEKCWWIKSFFHSEPTPPNVGRKTLSASSTNS